MSATFLPRRRRFEDVEISDGQRRKVKNFAPVSVRFERFGARRQQQRTLDAELRQVVEDGAETAEKPRENESLISHGNCKFGIRSADNYFTETPAAVK